MSPPRVCLAIHTIAGRRNSIHQHAPPTEIAKTTRHFMFFVSSKITSEMLLTVSDKAPRGQCVYLDTSAARTNARSDHNHPHGWQGIII